MNQILPQAEELLSTLKQLMPTLYQQETLESLVALFLQGQGHSLPHNCSTKVRLVVFSIIINGLLVL